MRLKNFNGGWKKFQSFFVIWGRVSYKDLNKG